MGIEMGFVQSVDARPCREGILHQRKALTTVIPLKAASSFSILYRTVYNLLHSAPQNLLWFHVINGLSKYK